MWDLPGGHIERSESPQQALARELAEELGIAAQIPSGEPSVSHRTKSLEFSVFLIDRWEGEPTNRAPHEHDEIRWVSVEELGHLKLADRSYLELLTRALSEPR